MAKRQSDNAADAANTINAADAATPAADATPAAVPTIEGTDIPTNIEPTADGSVEVAPAALPERTNVDNILAALNVLSADNPARGALTAALDTARGALALAEAEVALQATKAAEVAAATAAAVNLPAELLAAMLATIEAKYAPAPVQAPVQAAEVAAPYVGRKLPGAATQQRNAAALAVAASDPSVGMRCAATYNAFTATYAGDLKGVSAQAGTRYVSIVAFAGDGVASAADYKALVPQMRSYLLSIGLAPGGDSAATDAWLFALAGTPHGAGGNKSDDTLRLKFRSGAAVALCADGRFRLALPGSAGVKFVGADAQAFAIWRGVAPAATVAVPTVAEVAPAQVATPAAPRVPTPPAQMAATTGVLTATARCQHCHARNIVGNAACAACGEADWNAN